MLMLLLFVTIFYIVTNYIKYINNFKVNIQRPSRRYTPAAWYALRVT